MLTEKCWDRVPSIRPHIATLLDLFETTFPGWVPPTFEAIANLGLDHPSSQNSFATESADTMSRAILGSSEAVPSANRVSGTIMQ